MKRNKTSKLFFLKCSDFDVISLHVDGLQRCLEKTEPPKKNKAYFKNPPVSGLFLNFIDFFLIFLTIALFHSYDKLFKK